jgi:hypothetical protein
VKGDLAALKRTTDQLDQLVRGGRSRPPSPLTMINLPPGPVQRSGDDLNHQAAAAQHYSSHSVNRDLHPGILQNDMPTPPPSTSPPIAGLPPLARNVVPRPTQVYQSGNYSSVSHSRSTSPLSGEGGHDLRDMNSPIGPSSETSSMQDTRHGSAVSRFGMGYNSGSAYGSYGGARLEQEVSPPRQDGRRFAGV